MRTYLTRAIHSAGAVACAEPARTKIAPVVCRQNTYMYVTPPVVLNTSLPSALALIHEKISKAISYRYCMQNFLEKNFAPDFYDPFLATARWLSRSVVSLLALSLLSVLLVRAA